MPDAGKFPLLSVLFQHYFINDDFKYHSLKFNLFSLSARLNEHISHIACHLKIRVPFRLKKCSVLIL